MATIQRERFVALNKQNGGNNGDNVGDVSVMELTERQCKILDLIKENPNISAAQMSVMMSVIKRTIERELSILRKKGLIAREGSPRTGRWIVK
jgi:ATP-dependent DNA helicase RecG